MVHNIRFYLKVATKPFSKPFVCLIFSEKRFQLEKFGKKPLKNVTFKRKGDSVPLMLVSKPFSKMLPINNR